MARCRRRCSGFLIPALFGWCTTAPAQADLKVDCEAFKAVHLPAGARMTSAKVREATGVFPEACIVRGSTVSSPTSTINWAVELPARADWNGRTLTFGGGGFDGFIPTDAEYYHIMAGPNHAPYVRMSSDSGHQVTSFHPWAMDETALRNHAFEANHLTLLTGTAIATQFYGRTPERRYMLGQSNGGRSGLVAAQRHPDDYDGIIAIEPAIFQQAHMSNLGGTTLQHIFASPDNWMNEAQIRLYAEAEMKACDGLDGLEDGVISNIEACTYDPGPLRCTAGPTSPCLTSGQIESIRMIHSDQKVDVTSGDGSTGYPRFGRGGASTTDWKGYIFGTTFEARDSFNYIAASEGARVVEGRADAAAFPHDAAKYREKYRALSSVMDPTAADLTDYADHGKLILWYGTADTCVSIYRTVQYFERLEKHMGKERVQDFARFLVTPGVGHEMDGPGPQAIDLVSALDAWVSADTPPDQLTIARFDPAARRVLYERPACPWPQFARYDGTGDPAKATSFRCSVQ